MKGITPVIAVILLLLITISMVGFAFVWFTRLSATAQEQIDLQQNATTGAIAKKIRIDNAAGTAVTLRNIGTATVTPAEIGFFVNNVAATCPVASNIPPGGIATCTLTASCTGSQLKISAPGGSDQVVCK